LQWAALVTDINGVAARLVTLKVSAAFVNHLPLVVFVNHLPLVGDTHNLSTWYAVI
jgi:hypothetical protein